MQAKPTRMQAFDVAVVGAGHAGVEAALAAARMGCHTALFTMRLDDIALMPCNPSIGGTAKGHLVREIDALGGEMAKAADACTLQSRMLNKGKGPAVYSLRCQADRVAYHTYMKRVLEQTEHLQIIQAEIVDLEWDAQGGVQGVITHLGTVYAAKAVILCMGTYSNGRVFVGPANFESGPDGALPAKGLTDQLAAHGVQMRRFKTGTPARVHRRSIDFSKMERQQPDEPITPFSFATDPASLSNRLDCYIAYTNPQTHQVIRDNLHHSPLYSGVIQGVGPRYCPSIEDKVVRFADKERHQLFVEPMGTDTDEVYLSGMSSSLPVWVQQAFLRTIKGLEQVEIMRPAYAIEYDCVDPTGLLPSLEFKSIPGLYGAGQFNGTSGYEEAAAQGPAAGINAALKVAGKAPVYFDRSESYMGTLIDDLVTKGCSDPYRMMTSRSEYRLILRQDNADTRLTPLGHALGLIDDARYEAFLQKQQGIKAAQKLMEQTVIPPGEAINRLLEARNTPTLATGAAFVDLLRRPELDLEALLPFCPALSQIPFESVEEAAIELRYAGYIEKQLRQVAQAKKLEGKQLPVDLDYNTVRGLRLEAAQKLNQRKPLNVGQASRISGVSPADVDLLLIWLSSH